MSDDMLTGCVCGLRGIELEMPPACVADCGGPGDATEAVRYWAPQVTRPEVLTPEVLADCLREYGAWSADELEDDGENWERAVWLAACDAREGGAQ